MSVSVHPEIKVGDVFLRGAADAIYNAVKDFPFVDSNKLSIMGHSTGTDTAIGIVAAHPGAFENVVCVLGIGWTRSPMVPGTNVLGIVSLQDHFYRGATDESANNQMIEMIKTYNPSIENPKVGVMYGDQSKGNAIKVLWTDPPVLHAAGSWNPFSISSAITFIGATAPAPNPIDAKNHISQWREVLGLLGMLAMIWFVISLALALLKTNFFMPLVSKMPPQIGYEGKNWWISLALSIFIAIVLFPLSGKITLPAPQYNGLFNVSFYNRIARYLVLLPIADGLVFLLFHMKKKREGLAGARNYGFAWSEDSKKPEWALIGKSALLGCVVSFFVFTFMNFMERSWGVNFQWKTQYFSGVNFNTVVNSIGCILITLWVLSFTQLPFNILRRLEITKNDTKDTLIAVAINSVVAALPVLILAIIQIVQLYSHGTIFSNTVLQNFYTLPLCMAMLVSIHTVLFRKTGTIWPGMFVGGIFMGIAIAGVNPFSVMWYIV